MMDVAFDLSTIFDSDLVRLDAAALRRFKYVTVHFLPRLFYCFFCSVFMNSCLAIILQSTSMSDIEHNRPDGQIIERGELSLPNDQSYFNAYRGYIYWFFSHKV